MLKEYRENYGSEGREAYDRYMTQVYNYFALPPAMDSFCDASQKVARESLLVESGDLDSFALRNLPVIEAVFENFFSAFERYRTAVRSWDAEYGPPQPAGLSDVAIAATSDALSGGEDAPQPISSFDPSPSVAVRPAEEGVLTLPAMDGTTTDQGVTLMSAEQPAQAISQPVVQGEPAAQPGFGPTLQVDLAGTPSSAATPPATPQSDEVPTIVLTPQPEPDAGEDSENGGK
ncbi:hypothetical protein ETX26_08790 [Pelagerythrobacter rhizovicinus]|uniref:Uncharacterized protein n=1 Tax=Pelagerythrobacter rhizovicinus TaxID=2268576 RepID=A0A4Q2KG61_9SPHN|nr:hypothetical protein ETX26_08790 [Pelagerythrobacter rhizovicinus]